MLARWLGKGVCFTLVVAFSLSMVFFLLLLRVWAAHEPPLQAWRGTGGDLITPPFEKGGPGGILKRALL